MKTIIFITLFVIIILAGCSKDNSLKESVFINDTVFYDLPAYTEWGYNTFGTYYDRSVIVSNNYLVPAKAIITNDTLSFVLSGNKGSYHYQGNEVVITLKIPNFNATNYSDLLVLNDTIFNLADPKYDLKIFMDYKYLEMQVLSGKFWFKRAQDLHIDDNRVEVILSGYFDFKLLVNNLPITVSEGRFDVGIGDDNFYTY